MSRPLVRDLGDCPDCGLPFPTDGAEHECQAVDADERAYDRWETLRGGAG